MMAQTRLQRPPQPTQTRTDGSDLMCPADTPAVDDYQDDVRLMCYDAGQLYLTPDENLEAQQGPGEARGSIAWVQDALNQLLGRVGELTEPLDVDGIIGRKTRTAITLFQNKVASWFPGMRPLVPDGIAGPKTQAVMSELLSPSERLETPAQQTPAQQTPAQQTPAQQTPATAQSPAEQVATTTPGPKAFYDWWSHFPSYRAAQAASQEEEAQSPVYGPDLPPTALGDAEAGLADFRRALDAQGVTLENDAKVFRDARRYYWAEDPRLHIFLGQYFGMDGSVPSPELIARTCKYQQETGAKTSGVMQYKALQALLTEDDTRDWAGLLEKNRDLFGIVSARSTSGRRGKRSYKPAFKEHTKPFLGRGWKSGGVNKTMGAALERVEAHLLGLMNQDIDEAEAAGEAFKDHPMKGSPLEKGNTEDLQYWAGIREKHSGYRGNSESYHGIGSAIDLNYTTNPWVAVRSGTHLGGEQAGTSSQRRTVLPEALAAMDRACLWITGERAAMHIGSPPDTQGLSKEEAEQKRLEWVEDVYARFQRTSDAVAAYLSLAFDMDRDALLASKDPNQKVVSYRNLEKNLNVRDEADALEQIKATMYQGRPWTLDAAEAFSMIKNDARLISRVMVRGNASENPSKVRNPLMGFMDIKQELLSAMVSIGGLHWGGCELGSKSSGDLMHFDLGYLPPDLR